MSEYQAIYDAVRSRIHGCDVGAAIQEVARQCFDISNLLPHAQQEVYVISEAMTRPSVLYRPAISADGTAWCALYGPNLQDGVAGFGDTPDAAMRAFDESWRNGRTPDAIRRAAAQAQPVGAAA